MEFPRLVYRAKQKGSKEFDYEQVQDQDEHDAALKAGWFATVPEALAGGSVAKPVRFAPLPGPADGDGNDGDGPDDVDPPTREELEAKAKELGIGFNSRTSNKKLGELIEAALANPEGSE